MTECRKCSFYAEKSSVFDVAGSAHILSSDFEIVCRATPPCCTDDRFLKPNRHPRLDHQSMFKLHLSIHYDNCIASVVKNEMWFIFWFDTLMGETIVNINLRDNTHIVDESTFCKLSKYDLKRKEAVRIIVQPMIWRYAQGATGMTLWATHILLARSKS